MSNLPSYTNMTDNQPHNAADIASTRREFIKTTARLAVITAMAALGFATITHRNPTNTTNTTNTTNFNCLNNHHCQNCSIQNTCTLPPALSLRKSDQRSKS